MSSEKTCFHLVDYSVWPVVLSTNILVLMTGLVVFTSSGSSLMLMLGVVLVICSVLCWVSDVIRESVYEGQHTSGVQSGLRMGFMLFIVSELMFFVSFFFSYFWLSLSPSVEIGGVWPPVGIESMDWWGIPLLNTVILLSSGGSITYAHQSILLGESGEAIRSLLLTLVLGVFFTMLQGYEYVSASFSISDSVYGSLFYVLTGFHGFHVILGSIMLLFSFINLWEYEQTSEHHLTFEVSAVYWHFVDVVWLFLFLVVYVYN